VTRRSTARVLQIVVPVAVFSFIILFSIFLPIFLHPTFLTPWYTPDNLWYVLDTLATALAVALVAARQRGLVSDRAAYLVWFVCLALVSAAAVALCLAGAEVAIRYSFGVAVTALFILPLPKLNFSAGLIGWLGAGSPAPREPIERLSADELYERLVDAYLRAWGGPPERARARVEAEVRKLVEQGLSREEALRKLYR